MSEISNHYGQITMKFTSEQKEHYIVFERNLADNDTFLNWKIFIINYTYFI